MRPKKIVISGKVNLYLENFPDDNESTGVCESGWPPAAQGIGGVRSSGVGAVAEPEQIPVAAYAAMHPKK
jgi:hypothetical protein